MKLSVIDTGFFKLDGGAMFGVVPKSIWSKLEPADENNMCSWAMRCLLIESDGRRILVDTGIGSKQSDKFFSHYHLHGDATLRQSLANLGLTTADITDVLLTHFHFDHVGGALQYNNGVLEPTFPNAKYWTNVAHYAWAARPNDREKASFLPENFSLLAENCLLHYAPVSPYNVVADWLPNISLQCVYGHTEAMMLPHIHINGKTVVYCADLIPSPNHIAAPYVMGYDMRPLQTMQEKAWLLDRVIEQEAILFFEHDKQTQACQIMRNDKGKIVVKQQGDLSLFLA